MRICLFIILLAACGREEAAEPVQVAGIAAPCALEGAETFDTACRVVRTVVEGRTVLTLNAPDGGFRRVEVDADGGGIVAADGSVAATTRGQDAGGIEIAIAGDRYRLPAATR